MIKSITAISFFLISSITYAGVSLANCSKDILFKPQDLSTLGNTIEVEADESKIIKKNTYNLKGNALLKSKQYFIKADSISYQKDINKVVANGNVNLQNKELLLTSDKSIVEKDSSISNGVKYQLLNSKANGDANIFKSEGKEHFSLEDASYNLCPLGKRAWHIEADKMIIDKKNNTGIADDVVLKIADVPVFYFPKFKWKLKGRSSGFLAPSINSYSNSKADDKGTKVVIPYYFNIDVDKDLILALNHLTTRGTAIEAKYRQLLDKGNLELNGSYLDEDDIIDKKRWFFNTKLNLKPVEHTNLKIDFKSISDDYYFTDIPHKYFDLDKLESEGRFSYNKDDLYLSIYTQAIQALNDESDVYTKSPEIEVVKKINFANNDVLTVSGIATKFSHKDSDVLTANRTHVQAKYNKNIETKPYFHIDPEISIKTTSYSNFDNENNVDYGEKRSLINVNVDSHLLLERNVNENTIQTLKPRIYYNYSNEKEQDDIPLFDSAAKSFSYDNLFTNNLYTGLDRISSANDIAVGIESDFIDINSGDTYLQLGVAQRFYGDGSNDEHNKDYSDIAAKIKANISNYELSTGVRWDPEKNDVVKRTSAIAFQDGENKFINVSHNEIEEENIFGVNAALPLGNNTHIIAGFNKSLTNSRVNNSTIGVVYESCCWAMRLAHFKDIVSYTNNENSYDYVTKFEIILKGLGSSDAELGKYLEARVPNYVDNIK